MNLIESMFGGADDKEGCNIPSWAKVLFVLAFIVCLLQLFIIIAPILIVKIAGNAIENKILESSSGVKDPFVTNW